MSAQLEAKVVAVNRCNAMANRVYVDLMATFKPLLGTKITKADGELLTKVAAKLFNYSAEKDNMCPVYHKSSYEYALTFVVRTSEQVRGKERCIYHEIEVNIGNIDNHTLTRLWDRDELRTDYTTAEIMKARADVDCVKLALCMAESNLGPFGMNDF